MSSTQHDIFRSRPVRHADAPDIGAVILAAGPSSRMGTPKQLLQFRGQTLVRRAASAAVGAGCRPVVVVTGAHATATRKALSGLGVRETENKKWASGMSSSIRAGIEDIAKLDSKIDAIVLMLCDQPFATEDLIASLIAAHREMGRSIVASKYSGSYGVPVLFGKSHFAKLTTLEGEAGAKCVIQNNLDHAHFVNFPAGEIDIDTPEDLARLR